MMHQDHRPEWCTSHRTGQTFAIFQFSSTSELYMSIQGSGVEHAADRSALQGRFRIVYIATVHTRVWILRMFYSYDTRMLGVSGSYIATFYLPTDFSSRGRFGILRSMNFEHYTYPAICVVTTQEYTSNLVLDRRHAMYSNITVRARSSSSFGVLHCFKKDPCQDAGT